MTLKDTIVGEIGEVHGTRKQDTKVTFGDRTRQDITERNETEHDEPWQSCSVCCVCDSKSLE